MEVHKAAPADAAALAHIHRAARRQSMPWLPVLHSPEADLKYFGTNVLVSEDVMVVQDKAQILGFVSIKGDWVNHLYVDPGRWRRGVGSRLLEAAKASASRLQLWTFQRNTVARRFYASRGFGESEFTDGQGNEEKTPDVRMVWIADR